MSSATYGSAKLLSPDTAQSGFQEPIHDIYQVPRANEWGSRPMQCCLARVTWYIHHTGMLALGRKVCAAFPKILHGKQAVSEQQLHGASQCSGQKLWHSKVTPPPPKDGSVFSRKQA